MEDLVRGYDSAQNYSTLSRRADLEEHPMNPHSLFDLTPPEKLQLVEDLWDDLAAVPSDVPVHDWQKEELARRKEHRATESTSGVVWQEVKARIRSRYGR
jgi:putative addiction module component (TIGR02574 family)